MVEIGRCNAAGCDAPAVNKVDGGWQFCEEHTRPIKPEAVHHPAHYGGDTPYEVIKVLEEWLPRDEFIGAMKFNIHKYLARANKKDGAEAYAKAGWYSNYLEGYVKRHPEPTKIVTNIAIQLQRSMELNAKMKGRLHQFLKDANLGTQQIRDLNRIIDDKGLD